MTAGDFRYVGADGVVVYDVATAAATACLATSGTIVLDVPAVTGTLVYRPAGLRWQL